MWSFRLLKNKIKQYGLKNSFIRLIKSTLRVLGIEYEVYFICTKNLKSLADLSGLKLKNENTNISKLDLSDFISASHFNISQEKIQLYKKRFNDENYHAYGVYINDVLAYYCWISLEKYEISISIGNKFDLKNDQGLLLDAYCHPEFRGIGLHSYMNLFRLHQIRKAGKKFAVGTLLRENIPAIKSQKRVGFKKYKEIKYFKLFGKIFTKIISKKEEL